MSNSTMDGRSALACVFVMLVLFGSTTSAEKCELTRFRLVFCTELLCGDYCRFSWGETLRQYWCDGGFLRGHCNCKVCLAE
uniref:Uncharacterized protein n=1 Tax=Avena sativa TaxID=4498 RepID=A0ACD6A7K8_AVESA